MDYTPAQRFFIELVDEAKAFIGDNELDFTIEFADFQCQTVPEEKLSLRYIHPVVAKYDERKLCVLDKWLQAAIEDKLPTSIRGYAYYYTLTFYKFIVEHQYSVAFPEDKDALSFVHGLCLLNGIPLGILSPFPGVEPVTKDDICAILHRFSGIHYQIIDSQSATGQKAIAIARDNRDNKRLGIQLEYFRGQAKSHHLDIQFGTIDNPFPNIDEAISYIEFLENEAVRKDLYLNSEFITDRYRYDFADYSHNGEVHYCGLYKVPWASAMPAHVQNGFPKSSFVVTQLNPSNDDWQWLDDNNTNRFIPLFSLKPNLCRRRFLFRGQTEEYIDSDTGLPTCKPNLYRKDVEANPLPHRIKAYEMACLVANHPLVKLLGIKGVTIFNEPFRFQLNRLGLAQHYYNKTSFLDLTSDIQVAKFFATTSYCKGDDKYHAYASDDKLGVLYIYDMRFPDEFHHNSLPQLSTIGKQYLFPRSAMQSGFILNMPENVNLHELPNVYRIYFKHDLNISLQVESDSNYGEVYFPLDPLSYVWKDMRIATNSQFSISKKAREMYLHQHPNEGLDMEQLDRLLLANGFRLGENVWPKFPKDVLDEYYQTSLSVWDSFCSNVEFLGLEGQIMKRALMELPYNREYRPYFYKD